jgi:geranyl-CoA carboxylase alpha subunit
MIQRLLIANRGEIACRIMRTCRAMGITTIAVYSTADTDARHVQQADVAVHIGASEAQDSYLNIAAILAAARQATADAVHPGYGFLAENADFAQAVRDADLIWIGPDPETITLMGDKKAAKTHLDGIPYVAGYVGDDQRDDTLIAAAEDIGYPIMVKATAGGGGKGMRLVTSADALPDALTAARREARQAFGNETLMLEQALVKPRHIEVQIVGDHQGNVLVLGERECSIQRRHQKIIEEAPASTLSDRGRADLHRTALAVAEQLQYRNAGTIEFLMDADKQFYFMEMNTRLQVEHPVTEMIFDIDLVRWQIEIAEGTSLADIALAAGMMMDDLAPVGHAIEARIYAEDPANQFLPVTGDILHWQIPDEGRIDAGVQSGTTVSPYYDPMIAKVIAHGRTRAEALRKLDHMLARVQCLGMRHNIDFLRRVVTHPEHVAGRISTEFLDDHADLMPDADLVTSRVLIALALAQHGTRSHWRNNANRPIKHTFSRGDMRYPVQLIPHAQDGHFSALIGDTTHAVQRIAYDGRDMTLVVDGERQQITLVNREDVWWLHTLAGTTSLRWQTPLPVPQTVGDSETSLVSPMPGQVIAVHVTTGQDVSKGDVLLVMEAMKMEHRITAPYDGTIEELRYTVGDTVQADDALLTIQPLEAQ